MAVGEVGVGYTTVAAALMAGVAGAGPRGSGGTRRRGDTEMLDHKMATVAAALHRARRRGRTTIRDLTARPALLLGTGCDWAPPHAAPLRAETSGGTALADRNQAMGKRCRGSGIPVQAATAKGPVPRSARPAGSTTACVQRLLGPESKRLTEIMAGDTDE